MEINLIGTWIQQGAKNNGCNENYAFVTRTSNWMPNGGAKLDDCTIDKLKARVDAGAPEN